MRFVRPLSPQSSEVARGGRTTENRCASREQKNFHHHDNPFHWKGRDVDECFLRGSIYRIWAKHARLCVHCVVVFGSGFEANNAFLGCGRVGSGMWREIRVLSVRVRMR